MLERFAHFLLKKNGNAALAAFLCSILPVFFGSISTVIVGLVTLRKGEREGFFVLAWGILPLLARAFVDKSYLFFATAAIAFVLVWGMAAIMRHYSSWTVLLEVSALLGVCVVLATLFFRESVVLWWADHINNYMQVIVDREYINASEKLSRSQILWFAQLASGIEVLLLLLVVGVKMAVIRWWEARTFKTVAFRKAFLQMRFSPWALVLFFVLLLAASVLKEIIFVEALIPLAGLYVVSGLCMLHYWMQGYKYARSALIGFYIVLIIFPYAAVLALILGLVDSGFNLRRRISEV